MQDEEYYQLKTNQSLINFIEMKVGDDDATEVSFMIHFFTFHMYKSDFFRWSKVLKQSYAYIIDIKADQCSGDMCPYDKSKTSYLEKALTTFSSLETYQSWMNLRKLGSKGNIRMSTYCTNAKETLANDTLIESWCEKCNSQFKDCLDFTAISMLRRAIVQRYVSLAKYVTKRGLIDMETEINWIRGPKYGAGWLTNDDREFGLFKYNNAVKNEDGITALQFWKYFNPFYLYFDEKYFDDSVYDEAAFFAEVENVTKTLPDSLTELLKIPKIHGDYVDDFILVPLCSFGTDSLESCNFFNVSLISAFNKRCFTFNREINENTFQAKNISASLNFVINYRMPIYKVEAQAVQVILHQPGSAPDLNAIRFKPIDIMPQWNNKIGIKATSVETTDDFEKMSEEKKKCQSNQQYNSRHTCILSQSIEFSSQKCDCLPWYILETKMYENWNRTVCKQTSAICFEQNFGDYVNGQEVKEICKADCSFTKYAVNIEKEQMDTYFENSTFYAKFGDKWLNYISNGNPQALAMAKAYESDPDFKMLTATSLVQINFEDPEVTVITKDAKVTFADQLGSIGGTFGIFLGLSFLGLFEMMTQGMNMFRLNINLYLDKINKKFKELSI